MLGLFHAFDLPILVNANPDFPHSAYCVRCLSIVSLMMVHVISILNQHVSLSCMHPKILRRVVKIGKYRFEYPWLQDPQNHIPIFYRASTSLDATTMAIPKKERSSWAIAPDHAYLDVVRR